MDEDPLDEDEFECGCCPGEEELYDLSVDPAEHHNLAMKKSHRGQLQEFRRQHPTEFAPQGMGIKAGNLRPRFSGESFEWAPWQRKR